MENVSFGYARRRKHVPSLTNPFAQRWARIGEQFREENARPQVGDRVQVIKLGLNCAWANITVGMEGKVIRDDTGVVDDLLPFYISFGPFVERIWMEVDTLKVIHHEDIKNHKTSPLK
jgi:hypothetical protein